MRAVIPALVITIANGVIDIDDGKVIRARSYFSNQKRL